MFPASCNLILNDQCKGFRSLARTPGCSIKEKVPAPKPIKANLKPKPKMEVPGNRTLAGANPIFLLLMTGALPPRSRLCRIDQRPGRKSEGSERPFGDKGVRSTPVHRLRVRKHIRKLRLDQHQVGPGGCLPGSALTVRVCRT